ncbi:MAG: hypothetical protein JWO36_4242 [Myxococcales bacterium]|nr:hypothetical protein [Myxococcales bacterium]
MPEILTKHPDIVIKVLESQGAQCGTGAKPKILTKCPPDKFCTLAGGELCVFGSRELGQMTQLTPTDVCKSSVAPISGLEVVPPAPRTPATAEPMSAAIPLVAALVGVGLVQVARRCGSRR